MSNSGMKYVFGDVGGLGKTQIARAGDLETVESDIKSHLMQCADLWGGKSSSTFQAVMNRMTVLFAGIRTELSDHGHKIVKVDNNTYSAEQSVNGMWT